MRLIDADKLIEHKFVSIDCYLKSNVDNGFPQYKQGWNDAIDAIIDNAPTVSIDWGIDGGDRTVYARPQGEWIYDDILNNWKCSLCGETPKTIGYVGTALFMHNEFKFCNHCGAKMIGGVIIIDGTDMRGGRE